MRRGRWAMLAVAMLAGCTSVPGDLVRHDQVDAAAVAAEAAQPRRDWYFQQDGIRFDNRLPSARLTRVKQVGDGHYELSIDPETSPINPSPWYGFRISADQPRRVRIDFQFAGYRHRYLPKLSVDGEHWREASAQEFVEHEGRASLRTTVTSEPLLVFAQPPYGPRDAELWTQRLARMLPIERSQFGRSVQGRPLMLFEFGGDADSPILIVLGRQHPPEVTGSQALKRFVETLAGDTPAAREFRQHTRTIVIPMLNPDGVVEGHWRGNLRGKDLNRDWGPFAEPETRALRDALVARSQGGRRVAFAIDFHSTYQDVLYTVAEDPSLAAGGTLRTWIEAMQARFPGRIEEKAYAATSSVFKNWAYCRFGAPSVTYEVGDTTPADVLDQLSRHAADALMQVLRDAPLEAAPEPRCQQARARDDDPPAP